MTDRAKIQSLFFSIEHTHHIGFISLQWVRRGIEGFVTGDDRAPWWQELDTEHALNLVSELRKSIQYDMKVLKSVLPVIDEIEQELRKK